MPIIPRRHASDLIVRSFIGITRRRVVGGLGRDLLPPQMEKD
jgi:hypothetical protein